MNTPLRALIVEDSEDDCLLLKNELARGGYEVTYERVETAEAMNDALERREWDIIISDHRMPQFSSLAALKLHKERECDIPFIVVSGSIGEELAVSTMKAGANDYIMKDNYARLVPAVERELREAQSHRQRRRAEQTLEEFRRRLELILDAAGEGICGLNSDGAITFINPRGAKLVGWKPEELIGKSLHETIHHSWSDRTPFPREDCSLCATLDDGLAHWMDDELFWCKDGTSFPVEYTCRPIRDGDIIVGAVLTFQDITERKAAEAVLRKTNGRLENALTELRQAQQQAVQQERLSALGRMANGVAHDFNNALSKMLGLTELLLTSPEKLEDTETVRGHLRLINTAVQDAAHVVRRLREFYRPRRDTEQFKSVDLNAIIEEAIALTEPKWKDEAQAKGVTIQVRTELGPLAPVFADEVELREVLANLISNAVDAMPQGGTITVRADGDTEYVTLQVSDTGVGMTEEVRRHCFEPFYSTRGGAGKGLGLATAYGIIQRHYGEIQIESELHQGTTFSIRLPVHVGQRAKPPEPRSDATPKDQLNVLVVEDEPMIRDIEAEYLASDGHRVETAADGGEGLSKFRAGHFDLVLVDRAMPEINGDQLTEAIKESKPDLPVILVTGFADVLKGEGKKPQRADMVLAKPFSQAILRQAVQKVMLAA